MATMRQTAANRRNARKSTGPRTIAGKLRSRRNALRHGLTAETVIDVFENVAEYETLEKRMICTYRPRSMIEHELVVRLSSLLWRLRRATAIETGLFSIQAQILQDRKAPRDQQECAWDPKVRLYEMLGVQQNPTAPAINGPVQDRAKPADTSPNSPGASSNLSASVFSSEETLTPKTRRPISRPETLAQCFLRVAHLDDDIFESIGRYEAALWRQAARVAMVLHAMQKKSE